jgi:hypothetical protein
MGRLDMHLAACAIAVALLTAASSAVSAADTDDSAGSGSTNSSDSASGTDKSADHTDASTYSGGANADTAADQPGSTAQDRTGGAAGSDGEEGGEKKPVDDNSGTDNGPGDRTITRVPTMLPEAPPPEAPPPVDLAPLPEEVPPPPLAPVLPPIDLPPGVPAEPRPVDSTRVGASAVLRGGNAPPVLTAPVMVAPVPAMPGPILGASIAPRATFGGPAFTSSSRWAGEPAPPIRQPSTSEPLPTNAGLTARGQTSKEAGFPNEYLRGPRLSEMAAGALPGVAGMLIMTASGVFFGYRQAMAGQLLRPQGADRFLA